jgi:hypothetical protein
MPFYRNDRINFYEDTKNRNPYRLYLSMKALTFKQLNPRGIWEAPPKGVIYAYVNHGRWVVDCPEDGCGGAEIVSLRDPVFYCGEYECPGDGYWNVSFPEDLTAIEVELMKRPKAQNRNWSLDEKVADLVRENIEHGAV